MRARGVEPGPSYVRPHLRPGLDWYEFAFLELGTCRASGMGGPMPIPWLAIKAWCDEHGLDDEAADTLRRLVRALDAVYLAHYAPKGKPHGS